MVALSGALVDNCELLRKVLSPKLSPKRTVFHQASVGIKWRSWSDPLSNERFITYPNSQHAKQDLYDQTDILGWITRLISQASVNYHSRSLNQPEGHPLSSSGSTLV